MIYSGVDLIRKAQSTKLRTVKLIGPASIREPASPQTNDQEPDQQGALLRFARFVTKDKRKKPVSESSKHPYATAFRHLHQSENLGGLLDVYV